MADYIYERAVKYGPAALAAMDLRAILVMSNSTADTETEAEFVDDFTTLDEYDGSAYARVALAAETSELDLTNNRVEFKFDPIVFATLGVGTRQAIGIIIIKFVTDDTDSEPIFHLDEGGFPFDGNGENFTYTRHAEGVAQWANA